MATDGERPLAIKHLVIKIPQIKKNISQSTQHAEAEKTEVSIFSHNEELIYYCSQQNCRPIEGIIIRSLLQKLFTSSKG